MYRFLLAALTAGPLGCAHPEMTAKTDCGECHTQQAALDQSRHGLGHANPLFATAFERAQVPWCLQCHATDGLTCTSCHGESARTCVDCHQFDLPGSDVASQTTGAEHAASRYAQTPCQRCHDPHDPHGGHDEAAVRAAISVEALRVADGTRVELTSHAVGHAMPTGDPFRRLVLEVCEDLACRSVVDRHVLQRTLQRADDGAWTVASDTRIPPPTEGTTSTLVRQMAGGRAWRLTYRYADPVHRELGDAAWMRVDEGPIRVERP